MLICHPLDQLSQTTMRVTSNSSAKHNGAGAKVTIADVAAESNVSAATVSLVLRDKPGISAKTRQRVLDAAQALGYLYQASIQAQQRTAVNSIGLIIKSRRHDLIAANGFYTPVLAGIEEVCRRQQINLLYANLSVDDDNIPVAPPRLLTEPQTDGLLLVGMQLDAASVTFFANQATPIVLVDGYAAGDPYDAVVTDNFAGAYQATTYLVRHGHRHIGILGSQPQAFPSIQERRAGYRAAMAENDLLPLFIDCALLRAPAQTASNELLRAHSDVTALFCCNDLVAIAAMETATALGRRVPQDLSIIGFDNVAAAQDLTPPLTTMRVDKMGMGRTAAQLLINRIDYPEAGKIKSIIRPSLIERHSVR